MTPKHIRPPNLVTERALSELKSLILQHYPTAYFEVKYGHDDPESIHLLTVVDLEDTDSVFELVLERMMVYQIDDDLPIYVIPVRTPERVRLMRKTIDNTTRLPASQATQ